MVTNIDGRTAHRFRCKSTQASFYTYNRVVLFNIIIIIAVGMFPDDVVGSLAWKHMRHAKCTRLARWSVEDVLSKGIINVCN